jgi:outer membrane protein TolC
MLSLALKLSWLFCCGENPYNAPTVQVPQQFQYDAQKSKNVNLTDQWWTLFNDAQLNQLVDQVLAKNSDLTVAGITLKQARLQAGLAENKQGIRTSSSVSQVITMTSVQAMALIVVYRPVWC